MLSSIKVQIKGISPLLMHAYPMVEPEKGFEKWPPEDQAKISEYRDPDSEELYIPGMAIQRALINAAIYSKGKGRASMQKPVAACVLISPNKCLLGCKTYAVDSRPVVVPATKGRIMRHRPRLNEWSTSFIIDFDTALVSEKELRTIVDDAGSRVGLLDFRPERKGPFGRYMVVKWKKS